MVNLRHSVQVQSNFSVEAFGWVEAGQCHEFSAFGAFEGIK